MRPETEGRKVSVSKGQENINEDSRALLVHCMLAYKQNRKSSRKSSHPKTECMLFLYKTRERDKSEAAAC